MDTAPSEAKVKNQCLGLLVQAVGLSNEDCERRVRRSLDELLLSDFAASHQLRLQDLLDHAFDTLRELGGGGRKVCQRQFKRNDIVWICKSCQKDETCVQCNSCFQASSHPGHEVFFYHSHAGGCCDCGDAEAWDPSGFCPLHGGQSSEPVAIPNEVIQIAQQIIPQLYATILDHLDIYSHQNENLQGTEDEYRLGNTIQTYQY